MLSKKNTESLLFQPQGKYAFWGYVVLGYAGINELGAFVTFVTVYGVGLGDIWSTRDC